MAKRKGRFGENPPGRAPRTRGTDPLDLSAESWMDDVDEFLEEGDYESAAAYLGLAVERDGLVIDPDYVTHVRVLCEMNDVDTSQYFTKAGD